jgi:hypothetical protein
LCNERRAGQKRGTGAATGVCFEGSSVARGREEKGGWVGVGPSAWRWEEERGWLARWLAV